ncbi:hypothetical protein ABH931_002669 [Streptacidiphilus sp. MAP12-33]
MIWSVASRLGCTTFTPKMIAISAKPSPTTPKTIPNAPTPSKMLMPVCPRVPCDLHRPVQ